MTTQTYKYFQPEASNLRSEYGGGAIQDNGDSRETSPATLTVRHIIKELGALANGTSQLSEIGVDGSANVWFKVSDNLYSSISTYLTTAETTSAQSSAPSGYTSQSTIAIPQPVANRTNIILRGDSISFGLGTTSGDTDDTVWGQALDDLDSGTLAYDANFTVGTGKEYALVSQSLGSSSWANTAGGGPATYPEREDLAYNQRIETMPIDTGIFVYWLGTNDLAYDTGLSGADAWSRAASRIATFVSDFPNMKLIIATTIKRGELSALNDRIDAYNVAMRAGYASAGAHVLCDFEDNVSQVNIDTGDTTDLTYYSDGVHLTTAGHALLVPTAKTAIQAAEALL